MTEFLKFVELGTVGFLAFLLWKTNQKHVENNREREERYAKIAATVGKWIILIASRQEVIMNRQKTISEWLEYPSEDLPQPPEFDPSDFGMEQEENNEARI